MLSQRCGPHWPPCKKALLLSLCQPIKLGSSKMIVYKDVRKVMDEIIVRLPDRKSQTKVKHFLDFLCLVFIIEILKQRIRRNR